MTVSYLINNGALILFVLGLMFAFSNGFRDASTIVATVVSTRAISPTSAFLLCAVFEFFGAFLIGSRVASTIGQSLLGEALVGREILIVLESGLIAAFVWGILSWWRAWPTSNNQAVVSGLFGASVAAWGVGHFNNGRIFLVLGVLVSSPLIGFVISTLINLSLRKAGEWMTPKMKPIAESLHVMSCLTVSTIHGSNDGQLILGVISTLALVPNQPASIGLRLFIATALAAGVLLGGRRLLKKLGMKFFRIRDTEGLGAQMSAAITVLSCNIAGFPASTTQVIAGSIVGAGVAKNPRAVRWHIVQEIVLSWLLTLPSVAILAFLLCQFLMPVVR